MRKENNQNSEIVLRRLLYTGFVIGMLGLAGCEDEELHTIENNQLSKATPTETVRVQEEEILQTSGTAQAIHEEVVTSTPELTPTPTETPRPIEEVGLSKGQELFVGNEDFGVRVKLTDNYGFEHDSEAAYFNTPSIANGDNEINYSLIFHSLTWEGKKNPGQVLLDKFVNGEFKEGDVVRVVNITTGERITLGFLGMSEAIRADDFPGNEWWSEAQSQFMPRLVDNFIERNENNQWSEYLENGRNTLSITTCDTLDRKHIKTDRQGYALDFTHRRILGFVVIK